MKRFHIVVRGLVQGIGFRYYSDKEAKRLYLSGWVRNQSDGSVEIEVQGEEKLVLEFIEWVHQGPTNALVESVDITELPEKKEIGFAIV
jgi:acylphosphatase